MVTADVLNSPVLSVLMGLNATGVRFRLEGDHVLVSPPGVLTQAQREVFRQHQATVRGLVAIVSDPGVRDRCEAFTKQLDIVPPSVLVPRFVFRDAPYVKGHCHACGEALERVRWGSCWRCSLARRLACHAPIPADLFTAYDEARICT